MWPFGRAKLDEAQLERLRDLERTVAKLEVEWSDWFDRFRRLYAKIAKRAAEVPEDQPEPDRAGDAIVERKISPTPNTAHLARRFRGF